MPRKPSIAALAREATHRAAIARAEAEAVAAQARARTAEALADSVPMLMAGTYANARRNRLRPGPAPRGGAADYHLDSPDRSKLRAEAQQLSRDNPLARAILARLVELVGAGRARVQAKTDNAGWNAMAEAWFYRWAEDWCDIRGVSSLFDLMDQVVGAAIGDGDCGIITVKGGKLQLVEGERIINPGNTQDGSPAKNGGNRLVGGVEVDAYGKPVRYHVGAFNDQGSMVNTKTTAVDAADFMLAISPRNRRIGQTRGEPLFAGSLHLFEQLDEFVVSTLIAARMGTLFGLIIKAQNPADKQAAMLNALAEDDSSVDGNGRGETQSLRPAGVLTLGQGEDASQLDPKFPTDTFDPFVVAILRQIGADVGLPIELFLYDTTRTTFYGGRAATMIAHRGIERWQRWITGILRRVWKFAIEFAVAIKQLPENPQYASHAWTLPPLPPFDPKSHVETAVLAVQHHLSTGKAEAAAYNGTDWDDNIAENARERDDAEALGLTAGALPGQSATPGQRTGEQTADGSQP